jgi:hypothetical protein
MSRTSKHQQQSQEEGAAQAGHGHTQPHFGLRGDEADRQVAGKDQDGASQGRGPKEPAGARADQRPEQVGRHKACKADHARHSDPGAHRQGGSRRQDDPRPVEVDPQAPGPGLAQGQGVQGPARAGQEEQAGKDERRCKQGLRQAAVDEGAHQPVDDPVHCPGRWGQGQGEGHAGTGDRVEDHPGQQEDGHGTSPGGQGQKEAGPGQGTCHGRCGLDPTCGSGDPEGEDGPEGGGGRDAEDSRVGQGISRKALQGGTCQAQAGADQHGQ